MEIVKFVNISYSSDYIHGKKKDDFMDKVEGKRRWMFL